MTKSKKLLINSLVYVGLGFLTPAVNFLLLPIYTQFLDAEDYALITQSALIQSIFANLLGFGVNTAFARYFYDYYKDESALKELYSTALLSFLLTGLVTIGVFSLMGEWAIGITFKNDIFTFWEYGIYAILTAWFYNIQSVTLSYYRNQEKAGAYAFMSVLFFFGVVSSILAGVVFFEMKAKGSIIGRAFGSFLPVLCYMIWYFIRNKVSYSGLMNRKMILFGLPVVPYLLLNALLSQVDKFAVERYLDLALLGIYGFGFLIASVNDIFINALNSALSPQIYKSLKNEESSSNLTLGVLMKLYVSAGILVNLCVSILGAIAVHYLLNDKFNTVAPFLILLSLAYIPRVFYTNYAITIFHHKKTKMLPLLNVAALVVSAISLFALTPLWGLYGACIARILILGTQMVFALYYIKTRGFYIKDVMNYSHEYGLTLLSSAYIALWFFLPAVQVSDAKYLLLLPLFVVGFGFLVNRIYSLYKVLRFAESTLPS
jgi:O-antigen/teichoic acid export membrane protein